MTEMDVLTAKRLHGEINRRAPRSHIGGRFITGGRYKAAHQIYAESYSDSGTDFITWWKMIHKLAMQARDEKENKKMDERNGEKQESIKARYIKMIEKGDRFPLDQFIVSMVGCGTDTLSSVRSNLKKEGYDFEVRKGDGVYVTARPSPEQKPEPAAAPSVNLETISAQLSKLIDIAGKLLMAWGAQ